MHFVAASTASPLEFAILKRIAEVLRSTNLASALLPMTHARTGFLLLSSGE
jgi:hypothetical protein